MRVTNIIAHSRYFPYANIDPKAGLNMKPGQVSPELPLDRIHVEQLWKDLERDIINVTLSKEDLAFLNQLRKFHKKPVEVAELAPPPEKPKPKSKVTAEPALLPPQPPADTKIPDLPKDAPAPKFTEQDVADGKIDLFTLRRQNANGGGDSGGGSGVPDIPEATPGDKKAFMAKVGFRK